LHIAEVEAEKMLIQKFKTGRFLQKKHVSEDAFALLPG